MEPLVATAQTHRRPIRPTIVVINDWATSRGGADEVAITSAAGLARRGYRVLFLFGSGGVDPRLVAAGVDARPLGAVHFKESISLGGVLRGLFDPWVFRAIWLILDALPESTVVHVHTWHANLSSAAFWAPLLARKHVVATAHDYLLTCPNGTLFDYPASRVCGLVPLGPACVCRNCDRRNYGFKLWRVLRQFILNHIVRAPAAVSVTFVISRLQMGILRHHLNAGSNLHLLMNPIPVHSAPAAYRGATQRRGFVFVGRLEYEKGADIAARICAKVGASLKIVGDGTMRDALAKVSGKVEIVGWRDRQGVLDALLEARALIFPSRWLESFGLTPIEALACGTPVLVARNAAVSEFVEDDVDGYKFDLQDETTLEAAIRRLLDDTVLDTLLERVAARRGRWNDSEKTHLDALELHYRALLSRDRSI